MSLTVISPTQRYLSSTTKSFSMRCWCSRRLASCCPTPSLTVTRPSLVISSWTFWRGSVAKRTSRLVRIPTSLPGLPALAPSTTGMPEMPKSFMSDSASASVASGPMVRGFTTMPDSNFFTWRTWAAWWSGSRLRWMTPMPPACAMAIAIWASVTVSMAEARIGILTAMSRVMRLRTSASDGNTSDRPGCSNTSSNVRASRGLPFTAIANSHTPQRLDPLIPSYRDDRSTATERRSRTRIEARFWVGDGGYHGARQGAKGAAPFFALFLRLSVQPALSALGRIIFSILAAGRRRRRVMGAGLGRLFMVRILRHVFGVLALVFLVASSGAAPTEKRIALVIGNAAYQQGALPTTANDAGLIAQTLQAAGFDVIGARDLDGDTLRHTLRDFVQKAVASGPDTVAMVYLAGYGVQMSGENYFLPIDANVARDTDLPVEGVRVADYIRQLGTLPLRAGIFVLDGARAIPFTPAGQPLAGGLALVEPDPNMLVAFNAAPGTIGPNEPGPYGAYAQALPDVFNRTRLRVNEITKGAELPWNAQRIQTDFVFFERAPDAPQAAPAAQVSDYQTKPIRSFDARDAYTAALDRDTLEGYEEFLDAYASDPLAGRVRAIVAARREAITWRRGSGWTADRFGARTVFRLAIAVFIIGSIGCALSGSLHSFVIARFVQGMGGAMMAPVGRLVLMRSVDKRNLVDAMTWVTMPALIGPLLGPPLGGFITTYFSWHWIFIINVPIGLAGIALATKYIENIRGETREPFDPIGMVLAGLGIGGLAFGLTAIGLKNFLPAGILVAMIAGGALCIFLYILHARRTPAPVMDLSLFRLPSFRAGVAGGFLYRVGAGALPFLLPL